MAPSPGPKAPVAPPDVLPPSRSLLTAIPPLPANRAGDWEGGYAHEEGRGLGASEPAPWCNTADLDVDDACRSADREAFVLYAPELRPSQSTYAANRTTLAERQRSALANLERTQSFQMAREVLYGLVAQAESWTMPWLTDPTNLDVLTTAAQPYHVALDRLTDVWAVRMEGERGIIHMPPAVARTLLRDGAIEERGNSLYDQALGHLIVVDAGYAGAHPDGPSASDPLDQIQWIFISPNIDIRMSEVTYLPATEDDQRLAINRTSNVLTVVAQRLASYTWERTDDDPTEPLAVLGVPVDLCQSDCVSGAS